MFKRTYNSNHIKEANGSIKASFAQGWINYLDENDSWQSIDTQFKDVGDCFEMSKAPFIFRAPKFSTGIAEFISNNRYDIFTKTKISTAPFTMSISPIDVSKVAGVIENGNLGFGQTNYVIYKLAYPELNADLIYYVQHGRAPKLRKLIRFNSKPNIEVKLKFDINFDKKSYVKCGQETWDEKSILKTQNCLAFRPSQDNSPRGVGFYDFFLWDKWNGRKKINVELVKLDQNKIQLIKTISIAEFDTLSFPAYTDASASFNPDANPESTSVDGYIFNSVTSETWTQIHSGNGTSVDDSDTVFQVRLTASTTTNEYLDVNKAKTLFDTSSIGAGKYIDSASFNFTPSFVDQDDFGISLSLFEVTTSSNTSLSVNDFNPVSWGSTKIASDLAIASMSNDSESTMTLNAFGESAINMTGITKIGLTFYDEPTWGNSYDSRLIIYSAENGASEPRLDVTYFETSKHINLPLLGVG